MRPCSGERARSSTRSRTETHGRTQDRAGGRAPERSRRRGVVVVCCHHLGGMTLAQLGATVIRIYRLGGGADARRSAHGVHIKPAPGRPQQGEPIRSTGPALGARTGHRPRAARSRRLRRRYPSQQCRRTGVVKRSAPTRVPKSAAGPARRTRSGRRAGRTRRGPGATLVPGEVGRHGQAQRVDGGHRLTGTGGQQLNKCHHASASCAQVSGPDCTRHERVFAAG